MPSVLRLAIEKVELFSSFMLLCRGTLHMLAINCLLCMIRHIIAFWFLLQGFSNCSGNNLVQAGRLRRPQVVVQVCVFGVRASARQTHKLVEKDNLRRSRNMYVSIAPLFEKPGFQSSSACSF